MKKMIIAGASVTAFGLAMVPFTGVVEAVSHTDTVEITVPVSCSISKGGTVISGDTTATITLDNGPGLKNKDGTPLSVSCNKAGWKITAAAVDSTNMTGPATVATGTAESGDTANWMMKITATNATVTSGWTSYHVVPATTGVDVVTGSQVNNTSAAVITPNYQVYMPSTQPAGTYTGKVKYTFTKAT